MEEKTCCDCKVTKPVSEFSRNKGYGKGGYQSCCKQCAADRKMKYRYGVSKREYDLMLETQNHCCAICGIHIDEYRSQHKTHKHFSVDHSHSTGEVRGLLCNGCNVGLGAFRDNVEVLGSAIRYLEVRG